MLVVVKTPGERLKAWREAEGLTQDELAERLGCWQSTISRAEAGQTGLDLKWAIALAREAEALGGELPVSMWVKESAA
jgi:transcriptional regulator with XRE-family HTH domain